MAETPRFVSFPEHIVCSAAHESVTRTQRTCTTSLPSGPSSSLTVVCVQQSQRFLRVPVCVRWHGCAPWELLDGTTTWVFSTDEAFATPQATALSKNASAEYKQSTRVVRAPSPRSINTSTAWKMHTIAGRSTLLLPVFQSITKTLSVSHRRQGSTFSLWLAASWHSRGTTLSLCFPIQTDGQRFVGFLWDAGGGTSYSVSPVFLSLEFIVAPSVVFQKQDSSLDVDFKNQFLYIVKAVWIGESILSFPLRQYDEKHTHVSRFFGSIHRPLCPRCAPSVC